MKIVSNPARKESFLNNVKETYLTAINETDSAINRADLTSLRISPNLIQGVEIEE